ncbi:MAG TPA: hypothetical protein VLE48_13695 [Terriglobales bacterium]|nr:hypothetical protein [Terriglobales bacterium]
MTSSGRTFVRALGAGFVLIALATSLLYASHSWGGYHWARTSNPFTLKLGDNVSSTWDPILATAASDWDSSSVLNTDVVAGSTKPKSCRPASGRVEVCSSSYGNTGWLGIAQIWITGGTHITQGITKVNDYYHSRAPYNSTAWRRLVMCQEIGHTFGLDHQDENFGNGNLGTCMDYTNDPDGPPTNEHPNAHDYTQLENIYAHLDKTTTVGQTVSKHPNAMNAIDFEGPGQWGRLVARSRNGGTEVYELDFGGGHKVVTFVIWTLEERDRRNKALE